ncbi:hypothetical protein Ancab_010553 [Ancistrocladus abbreviatus]
MSCVPEHCKVKPSHCSSLNSCVAQIPVVDLAGVRMDPIECATVIEQIRQACHRLGFFKVVNHGISQSVLDGALDVGSEFFELPAGEKLKFMSDDVHEPVRYASSIKDGIDKVQYWRVFLKQYAHPLDHWIQFWPASPPNYRCLHLVVWTVSGEQKCFEWLSLKVERTSAFGLSAGRGHAFFV